MVGFRCCHRRDKRAFPVVRLMANKDDREETASGTNPDTFEAVRAPGMPVLEVDSQH
jgi:hypothetical protein